MHSTKSDILNSYSNIKYVFIKCNALLLYHHMRIRCLVSYGI